MKKGLFVWPGGKYRELKTILDIFPEENINNYFEPFLGGGVVFNNTIAKKFYINDLSFDVFNVFQEIKNNNKKLNNMINKINKDWIKLSKGINQNLNYKISEKYINIYKEKYIKKFGKNIITKETYLKASYFYTQRNKFNNHKLTNIRRATLWLFLRQYSFSGLLRFNSEGKYNVPYGGIRYNSRKLSLNIYKELESKIQKTKIFNLDFEEFFQKVSPKKNDFIFLDPPYDDTHDLYCGDSFSKDSHIRLANYLKKTKANFILVIKDTQFVRDLYKEFNIIRRDDRYTINIKNRSEKKSKSKHLFIKNY